MTEQNEQNEQAERKQTQKEFKARFVQLFREIDVLTEDVNQLKEDMKVDHPEADIANIVKMAKLEATQKLGEALAKAEKFANLVDEMQGAEA